jgi:hypothetical protein
VAPDDSQRKGGAQLSIVQTQGGDYQPFSHEWDLSFSHTSGALCAAILLDQARGYLGLLEYVFDTGSQGFPDTASKLAVGIGVRTLDRFSVKLSPAKGYCNYGGSSDLSLTAKKADFRQICQLLGKVASRLRPFPQQLRF